ncbi:MAG: transcription elongation factor GreA [bacterium]|nr:transcription elongation factor GreA [bacterium]
MDHYYLTQERLDELKKELETLKRDRRIEVADQLKRAKEFGDLSENAEYAEAREEQSRIEGRIFELDELLKKAKIITKTSGSDTVEIGSTVKVKKGENILTYTIVGSDESKPEENKISNESPLGRAFLNHRVGDDVSVHTPAGNVMYQVMSIE